MRIAVLGLHDSWYLRDLTRAAGDRHTMAQATFRQVTAAMGMPCPQVRGGDVALDDVDAVLIRTMSPGTLEQVVFRMDALATLEALGVAVVNRPKAVETAVDKYLALVRLQAAGLPVPRTVVCQSADEAMLAFDGLGRDVVLKPLFGSEGRGIARLTDEALALRAFKMLEQLGAVLYLQEFVRHPGHDTRLLVIGDRVLGMRRHNELDWRTNISRGARGEPLQVTPRLAEIAHRAANAVGATLAGVDLLSDADGNEYVIEVNAVPGWKGLGRVLGIDVASLVLEHVECLVRGRGGEG